jgi:D-tyrosyl-tRNA(Tyr) deacylase
VRVADEVVGQIDDGLLVLVGARTGDSEADADWLADKVVNLRIFEDENEKMNLSLKDVSGSLLAVSQFTLYADTRKGRRPAFVHALEPVAAEELFRHFQERVREKGVRVESGVFGAKMAVESCNWGPVTIILDSDEKSR